MPTNFQLTWDNIAERLYKTGVDHCVLYKADNSGAYPKGVAWSGITAITESPSGAEPNPIYADNIKYLNLYSAEDYGLTVEALYYPDEFADCNGEEELVSEKGVYISQQERKSFGLCYRTRIGNDVDGDDHGYEIHIVYGCKASPSEQAYNTVNDSPEPATFSWEISTVPVPVTGFKPTAHMTINSLKCPSAKLTALETILYGTAAVTGTNAAAAVDARLPLPDEIITILNAS